MDLRSPINRRASILRPGMPRRLPAPTVLLAIALLGLAGCREQAGVSENVPGIPVYPGAVLEEATPAFTALDPDAHESRDATDSYTIADADQAAVLVWYREQMPKAGWTAISSAEDEVVIYNDAKGCYAFVSVSETETGVFLQISRQNPETPCIPMPLADPGSS
jgi:hypothetical protein